jgi:hypothetical protein
MSHRNHRNHGNFSRPLITRILTDASFADLKENQENPTHEPDALAELVIPSALILLENKLSDNLIADVIIPSWELCLIRRKNPAFLASKTVTCPFR